MFVGQGLPRRVRPELHLGRLWPYLLTLDLAGKIARDIHTSKCLSLASISSQVQCLGVKQGD
jgi:hypothetical protein